MRCLDAAETILSDVGKPLTVEALVEEALRRGLIHPTGKTPVATMSAALYMDVRENPTTRLVHIADPGPNRARRNSVRWTVRDTKHFE